MGLLENIHYARTGVGYVLGNRRLAVLYSSVTVKNTTTIVSRKEILEKMKYEVIEYRSIADTYEVEASSEEEAEDLVAEGKATLIRKYEEHEFYEVDEIE